MAVQACVKPKLFSNAIEDDDDDKPLIFKRSNATKQSPSNSEKKETSTQKHNGQPGRQASDLRFPNAGNSSIRKPKMVSSVKALPLTSPLTSPEASTSYAKVSPMKSSIVGSKEPLVVEKSKHSSKDNVLMVAKEENHVVEEPLVPNSDSKNFEDDKPSSLRTSARSLGGNSDHVNKAISTSSPSSAVFPKESISMKNSSDDSDDEVVLSSKFQMKSKGGTPPGKPHESDEKQPLASKIKQNGCIIKTGQQKWSANKRPPGKIAASDQSLLKKSKIKDASRTVVNNKVTVRTEAKEEDDDLIPISHRMKKSDTSDAKSSETKQKLARILSSSSAKASVAQHKSTKLLSSSSMKTTKTSDSKYSKSTKTPPSSDEGQKWTTLVHDGVIFPPPYKPHGIKMLYKGKPVNLSPEQEEVATMFAVMLDTDYAKKEKFVENFMNDWKQLLGENHIIQNFVDCDFTPIYEWHQKEKEKKKQMSAEEKKALKEEKLKQEEKYMWATVDGVKEKVGNFRVEPPGLFRGRGEHPKMGKLKRRIYPSDITINIGKDAPIPECPIPGQSWKEIRHDNTVTWLAFWNDPINPKEFKYVFLAASSSLKGQSDKEKYEKARILKNYIQGIRASYTKNFTSKDITKKQIAVATYLIDKLALRAGNEKDDEEADTVGCCTLKVENVQLIPPNKLEFDFLGKDSIQYNKLVDVELPVYKAIGEFQVGKEKDDALFDRLDTTKLNAHLKELMPGLTAKVFRTYNASITLDDMLNKDKEGGDVGEKVAVYQCANKEVAVICNHQRSVSKSHDAQMSRLNDKIDEMKDILDGLKTDLARAKKGKPPLKDADGKRKRNLAPEALERKISQTSLKIKKMELDKRTKEDLKTVALGTSKINYLDPRITVAWCKRKEVPIEKIFNKSLLAKFSWAMDVDPDFRF